MKYQILQGDNRETLKTIADNSIDAIVTDPPYGIDFLGKGWDANTGALETYQECLRVLKPGGHILAFSAARTYHHLAVTLEQAGFEIRDQIMWIYSSGFPKSQDIGRSIQRSLGVKEHYTLEEYEKLTGCTNLPSGKDTLGHYNEGDGHKSAGLSGKIAKVTDPEAVEWEGWGTALKPAHEPIALARKPIKLSIARNAQQWGTGALNIDACRIDWDEKAITNILRQNALGGEIVGAGIEKYATVGEDADSKHETQRVLLNEQGRFPSNVIGEILQADYQKYFYCPKVSRRERHIGYDTTDIPTDSSGYQGTSNGGNYLEKKQIDSVKSMLEDMSGYFIDNQGNAVDYKDRDGKNQVFLPHLGPIYIHGLKHEFEIWCKANNKISNVGNNHPTVKPIELMKYLIKLITPPGGTVLDPFNGSGSTGCAAVELGFEYIGCELDPAYVEIAKRRIEAWNKQDNNFEALFSAT